MSVMLQTSPLWGRQMTTLAMTHVTDPHLQTPNSPDLLLKARSLLPTDHSLRRWLMSPDALQLGPLKRQGISECSNVPFVHAKWPREEPSRQMVLNCLRCVSLIHGALSNFLLASKIDNTLDQGTSHSSFLVPLFNALGVFGTVFPFHDLRRERYEIRCLVRRSVSAGLRRAKQAH